MTIRSCPAKERYACDESVLPLKVGYRVCFISGSEVDIARVSVGYCIGIGCSPHGHWVGRCAAVNMHSLRTTPSITYGTLAMLGCGRKRLFELRSSERVTFTGQGKMVCLGSALLLHGIQESHSIPSCCILEEARHGICTVALPIGR